jgi:hypothetical protein
MIEVKYVRPHRLFVKEEPKKKEVKKIKEVVHPSRQRNKSRL